MQLAVAVRRDLFTHRASGPWSDEHGRVLTLSPFPSSQTKYIPAADHFFHLPGPGEMHGCLHAGSRDAAGSVCGHPGCLRAMLPFGSRSHRLHYCRPRDTVAVSPAAARLSDGFPW